jgi:hypothetical protein
MPPEHEWGLVGHQQSTCPYTLIVQLGGHLFAVLKCLVKELQGLLAGSLVSRVLTSTQTLRRRWERRPGPSNHRSKTEIP